MNTLFLSALVACSAYTPDLLEKPGLWGPIAPVVDPITQAAQKTLKEQGVEPTLDGVTKFMKERLEAIQKATKKVEPAKGEQAKKIQGWIQDLGSEKFSRRANAEKDLLKIGRVAESALKKALDSKDQEIVDRAEKILATFKKAGEPGAPELHDALAHILYSEAMTKNNWRNADFKVALKFARHFKGTDARQFHGPRYFLCYLHYGNQKLKDLTRADRLALCQELISWVENKNLDVAIRSTARTFLIASLAPLLNEKDPSDLKTLKKLLDRADSEKDVQKKPDVAEKPKEQ